LENHSDAPPNQGGINLAGVEILAKQADASFETSAWAQFMHAVQAAQKGGLAAAAGPDYGCNSLGLNPQTNVKKHLALAKPYV
jgi:hypothetical protein